MYKDIQHCRLEYIDNSEYQRRFDTLKFKINYGMRTINKAKLTNAMSWVFEPYYSTFTIPLGLKIGNTHSSYTKDDYVIKYRSRVNQFMINDDVSIIPWSLMLDILFDYDKCGTLGKQYLTVYSVDENNQLIDYYANMLLNDYNSILSEKR